MNKLLQELKESKTADEFAGLSSIISLSIQENPARWIDELEAAKREKLPVILFVEICFLLGDAYDLDNYLANFPCNDEGDYRDAFPF